MKHISLKLLSRFKTIPAAIGDRVIVYGLIAVSVSILGFFSRSGWLFELCSHFRLPYLILSILLLIVSTMRRKFAIAMIAAVFSIINAVVVLDVYFQNAGPVNRKLPTARVLLFNINSNNSKLSEVRSFIRTNDPDIIVLLEQTVRTNKELELAELGYQYEIQKIRDDSFGIGLFSKSPLIDAKVLTFGHHSIPSLFAKITFGENTITLIGSHPLPPRNLEYYHERNRQLADLGNFVSTRSPESTIVLMDMNASPWSYVFEDFKKHSGLKDSREGFGIGLSWPTWLPFLWTAIDHVFVSKNIHVVSRNIGPMLGSDHFPVVVDFTVEKEGI